jgi:hypothetical protein
MNKEIKDYRSYLVLAEQIAQEDFDKTVLTLSGGALGISFAFIKDIIGANPIVQPYQLYFAWISWGLSVTVILASYFFSSLSLRKAIQQLDSGDIYVSHVGGLFDVATCVLNVAGGLLFIIGVIFIVIFVRNNLGV